MKRPPDHEAGLALLLRLKGAFSWYLLSLVPDIGAERDSESEPDLVEDAVKYIIFLVDADRLFDTALGMYDFSLVLMIAQHAQKVRTPSASRRRSPCRAQDPREYLPFLRELRALEAHYQHFRIDDHLRRHERALRSLSLTGARRLCPC